MLANAVLRFAIGAGTGGRPTLPIPVAFGVLGEELLQELRTLGYIDR